VEIREALYSIKAGTYLLIPELILTTGIIAIVILGFFRPRNENLSLILTLFFFAATFVSIAFEGQVNAQLFGGMIQKESFSGFLKLLLNASGLFTIVMALNKSQIRQHRSEFSIMLIAVVLGGHFLLMSNNLLMIFLSMEVVSISSYVVAGFAFNKQGSEGSLKFFLFGSVASAVMLYGFSIFYGITGTLIFTSERFANALAGNEGIIVLVAGAMSLAGMLFKIAAAPMHPWAPDVYEAAPYPVLAFLSTVPKLAGIGILSKFIIALYAYGQSEYDWQVIIALVSMLTITVGNFAALAQKNPKRLMAYSSIAQSGFLLIGVSALMPQGLHFMLFYAAIYVLMNFTVFICLSFFEKAEVVSITDFSATGRIYAVISILLLVGLISLTGLPPTSGFTGKLFIFSALWQSYELSGKTVLLWLLIMGLLNTVVSLFYYLKIPFYAFLKDRPNTAETIPGNPVSREKFIGIQNLLAVILVLLILALFFAPGLLMGWINKVNFVF
jgi:NADH-quinone oxidoreductase subunit N